MKENIKIERLFQEKLKDFESQPPIDSWEVISSSSQINNIKKRVIPLWVLASSIAASFLLLTIIGWNIFNSSYKTKSSEIIFVKTIDTNIINNPNN